MKWDKNIVTVVVLLLMCFASLPLEALAQKAEIKTNLLYWATSTPNVGFEGALSSRFTLSGVVGYNAFNFPGYLNSEGTDVNPKFHHLLVFPELKYWFCRSFERGYLGLHGIYTDYNVGGLKPFGFLGLADTRYRGHAYGSGMSYGYQWALGESWGFELSLGVGYVYLRYSKYDCGVCGAGQGAYSRHYFGPTKAAVSFSYYIR